MATPKCPRCASERVQRNFGDAPLLLRLVGFNELLCNNCNAEFRGFAPLGSARRSRNRKIELGGGAGRRDRRRAQRYAVRIPAHVGLFGALARAAGAMRSASAQTTSAPTQFLEGYTRNLSSLGLAVVLPETRFTDTDIHGGGGARRVRVLLQIQPRTVTLDATVVRYEQLDDDDALTGWLIALRITRMNDADRASYARYLKTFGA